MLPQPTPELLIELYLTGRAPRLVAIADLTGVSLDDLFAELRRRYHAAIDDPSGESLTALVESLATNT